MRQPILVWLLVLIWFADAPVCRAVDISNSLPFTYDDGSGNTLLYRLFFPPEYDTPGASFPLVTFLHGSGEIGSDNISQLTTPHIEGLIEATRTAEHAAFLLVPQVQPGQGSWSAQWSPTALATATELTLEVIDQLEQQYQIDPTRRSITGFSMGGFGTWDVIAKRPDLFAAAAPVAGGGDTAQAANLVDVPIWNFHGRSDGTVSVDLSRNMIAAIEDAGGNPIYLEPQATHGVADEVYDDPNGELYDWLLYGIEPPLATLIYNPLTGNLKIDAGRAPGGVIDYFLLSSSEAFTVHPTMTVDGNVVNTLDFATMSSSKFLAFNNSFGDDFSGVADFGPIMRAGLSRQELHFNLRFNEYFSPATDTEARTFRLIMEIPEPATYVLGVFAAASLLAGYRRRVHSRIA